MEPHVDPARTHKCKYTCFNDNKDINVLDTPPLSVYENDKWMTGVKGATNDCLIELVIYVIDGS